MTSLVNLKHSSYTVYIGRKKNERFHFGNPFSHLSNSLAFFKVQNREEAINAYRDWLLGVSYFDVEQERREWILNSLSTLEGQILGCFCVPEKCHGDVLLEFLNKITRENS